MKLLKYIFFLLFLILALIVLAIFQLPDKNVHIIACDVGEGDAILVTYENIQILTDGGPDNKVLTCLGRHVPFWDRQIELVISTHLDSDHITGLIEVVRRFKVDKILINPSNSGTSGYRVLQSEVGSRRIDIINPGGIRSLRVGMIHLDILNPLGIYNDQFTISKSGDTNSKSIAYLLTYGSFRAAMLGDVTPEVSDKLSASWELGTVNYIKIPHHGSSNGLTQNLLEKTRPRVAVISVGEDNPWGFPSDKILQMLSNYNVKILRTDLSGDVEIVTDGDKIWIKN